MPEKLTPLTDPDNFVAVWDDEQLADQLDPAKRRPKRKQDETRRRAS